MADTIIQQGMFTSNGKGASINLVSGVDWIRTYNITNATAAQTVPVPVEWYWQNGFPAAAGIKYQKSNAANALSLEQYVTAQGFTIVTGGQGSTLGNPVVVTGTSNAAQFVVSTATTTGLSNGSIVRLSNINQPNVNGFDFSIGTLIASTSFVPAATFANAPGGAGGAGFYRIVNYNPLYYPTKFTISDIATNGANGNWTDITTTIPNKYQIGQEVTFRINSDYGMVQLNGLTGTIVALTAPYTFTVNINTAGFTPFVWANFISADTYPTVLPVGEDTSVALANNLYPFNDATVNTAFSGIYLYGATAANTAATSGPAGQNGDVIYWVAGKSFLVDNTASLIIQ